MLPFIPALRAPQARRCLEPCTEAATFPGRCIHVKSSGRIPGAPGDECPEKPSPSSPTPAAPPVQAHLDGHGHIHGCAHAGLAKATGKPRGNISAQIKLIFVILGWGCRAAHPGVPWLLFGMGTARLSSGAGLGHGQKHFHPCRITRAAQSQEAAGKEAKDQKIWGRGTVQQSCRGGRDFPRTLLLGPQCPLPCLVSQSAGLCVQWDAKAHGDTA